LVLAEESSRLRDRAGVLGSVRQLGYTASSLGAHGFATALAKWKNDDDGIEVLWATLDRIGGAEGLRGHSAEVAALAIATDGTQAFSAAWDATTRRWRLASGRLDQVLPTHADVAYVHTGPDVTGVLAGYRDGTAQAWDVRTGHGLDLTGPSILATAFAMSSDACKGLSGDPDRGVSLWELTDIRVPRLRLAAPITAAAVSADGHLGATALATGEITVWDLATGDAGLRINHDRRVLALCLTPLADRLIIGDDETLTVVNAHGAASDTPAPVDTVQTARLTTRGAVTAVTANPVFDRYVLFGTASGQVVYVHVP
jgi:WD40 repeat protein